MQEAKLDAHVEVVRQFNRFYTQQIGVLQEKLLDSPFSLTESRVLYELAQRHEATASELAEPLKLDTGYLSRILHGFGKRGLLTRKASAADKRQRNLSLTKKGQQTFAALNARSQEEIAAMLGRLPATEQTRLVEAMRTIQSLLNGQPGMKAGLATSYLLRPHQPGDLGWVIYRHGVLYAEEYGYDETFEALVAEIAAHFVQHFDPKKECCWIAEREGEIVGSIFLVKKAATIAKLRLLLVEPSARGLGIGTRLVSECTRFARQAGYKKIVLWTQRELSSARRLYEQAGYHCIQEEPHHSFGKDLVAETWELKL
jgi:DNA-binding MarR family transcriptional regulator/GNAT superfamily N-acetyltransferase